MDETKKIIFEIVKNIEEHNEKFGKPKKVNISDIKKPLKEKGIVIPSDIKFTDFIKNHLDILEMSEINTSPTCKAYFVITKNTINANNDKNIVSASSPPSIINNSMKKTVSSRRGFAKIGTLDNFSVYLYDLNRLSKVPVDYTKLDKFIDEQWEKCSDTVLCYDENLNHIDSKETNIKYILVNTGYAEKYSHKRLYGGFLSTTGLTINNSTGKWRGVFIGTEEMILKDIKIFNSNTGEPPGDNKTLYQWASITELQIKDLANKALKEKWYYGKKTNNKPYSILYSYLRHTYRKLWRDKKVILGKDSESSNKVYYAFNTGLVDKKFDDIFALFEKNTLIGMPPWRLVKFVITAEGHEGKILNRLYNPPLERARYFTKIEDTVYDKSTGALNYDLPHILAERLERFPIDFIKQNCGLEYTIIGGYNIDNINSVFDKEAKQVYFETLAKKITNDDNLLRILKNRFDDAIELAEKRIEWNYKTAIPQYFPTRDSMSLLLPLALVEPNRVDLALVVERNDNGTYQGHTVLTLDMAYSNARQITRPDNDWLKTEEIETNSEIDDE